MCRLFGLHAGPQPVRATFWLLDAPDSLAEQSRREPDGAGIGTFDDSERLFALITAETRRTGGDVGEGIARAIRWIARELPVFSLNLIVTTNRWIITPARQALSAGVSADPRRLQLQLDLHLYLRQSRRSLRPQRPAAPEGSPTVDC